MAEPKHIELTLTSGVTVHEHASVVKSRDDRVVGYAESERDGMTVRADQLGTGDVASYISGPPPPGESDTLEVAKTLVAAMNARGATWGEVTRGTAEADCKAECTYDRARVLLIQVVRAWADQELWRRLATDGSVHRTGSAAAIADQLVGAIRLKAKKYPPIVRSGLVLALDASRVPAMILTDVHTLALDRTQSVRQLAGFQEVWVVGPTQGLTYKLGS